MYLPGFLASLVSVAALTRLATASLRVTADNHSFGGVNYPTLQFLEPSYRDDVIRAIVKSDARVIRLFMQGDKDHPDAEPELGSFDKKMLDQFDDALAAIHRISKGQVKVIISPHNAHALRGSNDVPCDAYCKKINGAFLDFYSNGDIREIYKTRLEVFFKHYPSKNFQGRPWGTLNEVLLGVDIQNEPWSGISPIVSGESWLCEIATHLKDTLELGKSNIAVITGGISGPQSVDGVQNFPDSAFNCPAVDVIGIHGYFSKEEDATAGTPWAKMLIPGNTLTGRALGNKLLLVEEWAYMNTKWGLNYKKEAVFDQGNALNYRGIPWLYSHATTRGEGTTSKIDVLRDDKGAIGALKDVLRSASTARSNFNWTSYLTPPAKGLTNLTALPVNPYIVPQQECSIGCEGFLCDAADGCAPDLICKNSVCQKNSEKQPGKINDDCNSKKPCQEHLRCESGVCSMCDARRSIDTTSKHRAGGRKIELPNDINGNCAHDLSELKMRPFCKLPPPQTSPLRRGNPCENPTHCDANEYCDWGLCKVCTEGCLGMSCRSNNKCKTGYCNPYGKCDYAGQKRKKSGGGARATTRNRRGPGYNVGPKRQEGGPNKVRDEAMRINIPKEQVKATGGAQVGSV